MLYTLRINQKMSFDENISINAVIVFEAMYQLSRLSYATIKVIDGKNYYVLIRSYIIKQLPQFNMSLRSLTRALSELENAELIESIDKTSPNPAYAFTRKSDKYTVSTSTPASGDTEPEVKSPKKQPMFSLPKDLDVNSLSPQYLELLQKYSLEILNKQNIDKEEFAKFLDHHNAKGTKFKNWISAFRNWVRNYRKYNPLNPVNKNGMYM